MNEKLVKETEVPSSVRKVLSKYKGIRYELRPMKVIQWKLFVYGLPKSEEDNLQKLVQKTTNNGISRFQFESVNLKKIRETIRKYIKELLEEK